MADNFISHFQPLPCSSSLTKCLPLSIWWSNKRESEMESLSSELLQINFQRSYHGSDDKPTVPED